MQVCDHQSFDDKFLQVRRTTLLNTYPAEQDNPYFANSVDPDQMASEEAIWSWSTLLVMQFVN